jgi:hypothetical protein
VNDSIFSALSSELDVVELVFGSSRSANTQKRYNSLDTEQLLCFFLYRFLLGLEKHQKHDIKAAALTRLYQVSLEKIVMTLYLAAWTLVIIFLQVSSLRWLGILDDS